jgi:hypothetical protein
MNTATVNYIATFLTLSVECAALVYAGSWLEGSGREKLSKVANWWAGGCIIAILVLAIPSAGIGSVSMGTAMLEGFGISITNAIATFVVASIFWFFPRAIIRLIRRALPKAKNSSI